MAVFCPVIFKAQKQKILSNFFESCVAFSFLDFRSVLSSLDKSSNHSLNYLGGKIVKRISISLHFCLSKVVNPHGSPVTVESLNLPRCSVIAIVSVYPVVLNLVVHKS
jgi:hypothetical protein